MATEVIFLRVPPEVKLALEAQVEGLNKNRPIGQPEHTLTSFVLACVNQVLAFDDGKPRSDRATKAQMESVKRHRKRTSQAKRAAERAS